jgi:heptosyltransferase I
VSSAGAGGPRILVTLLTGLGDVVHGLPVVNALRRRWPGAHITWVVEPPSAGLLERHPAIDRVVVYRKREGVRGVRALRRELRGARPDIALNFNIYLKSVWPLLAAWAPVRIGFDRARTRDGVWLLHNRPLAPGPRAHTQDMFLEFLDVLGVERGPVEWRLEPDAADVAVRDAFARSSLADIDASALVALVPASANAKKDWPAERQIELCDALGDAGLVPMLVGGPGARENALAARIAAGTRARTVHAMGDDVRRLLWLLPLARVVVAPDTGPVHVARALGVPVVGLYGHSNPWRVGPYRAYEELWVDAYTEPGHAPDPSRAEPKHGRMERITVDAVMQRVERALRRQPAASRRRP